MAVEINKYTYRVMWSEEDEEFVGLCAEFPSLSWLDESQEEALKGITSVVGQCIEDLLSEGKDIPLALSSREYSGKFMVRIPPKVHRDLAIAAAESNISLNRLASAKLAH